ncbi:hypothetical protein CDL12_08805 [Handroanthus impetiginosus]|uniref:Uncharacterized protein n=1 Tax=Handroanthus impetiginosus TaxID=429701 RepID=A0A2G9HLX1_9LAMI|nr:hypothetical protein CDL12_08805 [Handroanthus impetiginosus]
MLLQFMANTAATFKAMEIQIGQLANAMNSQPQESLPSNIETNPKKDTDTGETISQIFKFYINIPFAEALEQMPSYIKFMKDILTKKRCLGYYEMITLTKECSGIIQKKLRPKLEDPGSFTIPCKLDTHFWGKALCDSETSINIMPPLDLSHTRIRRGKIYDHYSIVSR